MSQLTEVTDRFSIFKDGRTIGANGRKYLLDSIQRMLASKQFLEGIKLHEHYGYFGHQNRVRKGLKVPESEVIILEGKPINLTNIPSNYTVSCTVDDDGVVEHTQRILKSETGRVVETMLESAVGGWSWAVGALQQGGKTIARTFAGFDYVKQPNYVSLSRQNMMLESADGESVLLESLSGVVGEAAGDLVQYWGNNEVRLAAMQSDLEFLQSEIAMLENVQMDAINMKSELKTLAEEKHFLEETHKQQAEERDSVLLEAMESLPFVFSEEQRSTLLTAKDKDSLVVILEGVFNAAKDDSLPGSSAARFATPGGAISSSKGVTFHPKPPAFPSR